MVMRIFSRIILVKENYLIRPSKVHHADSSILAKFKRKFIFD